MPDQAHAEEVLAQRHLEALLRSSEPLQPLNDPASVAVIAAEQGAGLIPGIECAVATRDPHDLTILRVAGASGPLFSTLVGSTMNLDGSLAERALGSGEPVETDDAMRDSPVAASIPGAPSTARLVPLRVTDATGQAVSLGVIGYYRDHGQGFIVEERRLLDEYALRVAVALHRASLHAEVDAARVRTAQLADRLAFGVATAIELGGELDPRRVIRTLIEQVAGAVGADRVSFGRVDGDSVVIEDSVAPGGGEALVAGMRWRVDSIDLLLTAVRDRRPASASHATASQRTAEELMRSVSNVLIVPLMSQGRAVAILSVGRIRDAAFDDDTVAMLQQVGAIAVMALRNARLFESRRDFMNMAAHELRTPLTVLNGYLSMLRDGSFGPPSERWESPITLMSGKVDELAKLVDDLLIGARLERGAIKPDPVDTDLVALARDAVVRATPRATLLGGRVGFTGPDGALPVHADVDNVGRILDNLLNNALSYSMGAPRVEVRVFRDGHLGRVAVEDSGRGIPEALHERVFEQFFRIEDRRLGYPLGTGLGLYISRQFANAQGGRLRIAHSQPGKGSVFVLELPVVQ